MQVGYENSSQSGAADDHTIAVIDLDNHIALSDVKMVRIVLALGGDTTDFFA
jgi:hypothetical protein